MPTGRISSNKRSHRTSLPLKLKNGDLIINGFKFNIKDGDIYIDEKLLTNDNFSDQSLSTINLSSYLTINNHKLEIDNNQIIINDIDLIKNQFSYQIYDFFNIKKLYIYDSLYFNINSVDYYLSLDVINNNLKINNKIVNAQLKLNNKNYDNDGDINKNYYFLHYEEGDNENINEVDYFSDKIYYHNNTLKVSSRIEMLSDKNMKENIKELPKSLDKIDNINAYKYNLKDSNRMDIGLIAQEVEKEYPELVSTNLDGIKSVNYMQFSVVLLNCIKELKNEVNNLKEKINL